MNNLTYRIVVEVEDTNTPYNGATVAAFRYLNDAIQYAESQFDYYTHYYNKVSVTIYSMGTTLKEFIKIGS